MKKYVRTTQGIFTTTENHTIVDEGTPSLYEFSNGDLCYRGMIIDKRFIVSQSDDIYELIQEGDLIAHDYKERTRIENVIEVGGENDHQLAIIRTETTTFWRYKGGEINLKNIVSIYVPSEEGYRKVWER